MSYPLDKRSYLVMAVVSLNSMQSSHREYPVECLNELPIQLSLALKAFEQTSLELTHLIALYMNYLQVD
jgi:hypothetical protein